MSLMRVAALVLLAPLFFACKTPSGSGSQLKADTDLASKDQVDLTTYVADADLSTVQDGVCQDIVDYAKTQNFRTDGCQWLYDLKTQQFENNRLYSDPFSDKKFFKSTDAKRYEGLQEFEHVALFMYTADLFAPINKGLRTKDWRLIKEHRNTILAVASALNKIPGEPCAVKRGAGIDRFAGLGLKKGKVYVDQAFMSTTYKDIPIEFQKGLTFEIKSDSCRKIDLVSRFPHEHEVLFPPGSEFLVDDIVADKTSAIPGAKLVRMTHLSPVEASATEDTEEVVLEDENAVGSPGTGGTTGGTCRICKLEYFQDSASGMAFESEMGDDDRSLLFYKGKSGGNLGRLNNSSGTHFIKNLTFDAKTRKVKVQTETDTQTFLILSGKKLGRLKAAASDEVVEYYTRKAE